MRLKRFLVRKDEFSELQVMIANLIDPVKAEHIYVADSIFNDDGFDSEWVHTRTPEGYTTGIKLLYRGDREL